jgi:hypothetical protein
MKSMSDARRRLWKKEDVAVIAQFVPLTSLVFSPACICSVQKELNRPGVQ